LGVLKIRVIGEDECAAVVVDVGFRVDVVVSRFAVGSCSGLLSWIIQFRFRVGAEGLRGVIEYLLGVIEYLLEFPICLTNKTTIK